jgi:excisionase family DNA binding protein
VAYSVVVWALAVGLLSKDAVPLTRARTAQIPASPKAPQVSNRRNPRGGGADGSLDSQGIAGTLTAARLLTAEQLAERWQVPKSHVWRLARRGEIPTVRLGRYMRFRLESIEAWECAQEVQTDD